MPLPEPVPGLVIRYSYLWADEHERGQEEGVKDRPCAIVLMSMADEGETLVIKSKMRQARVFLDGDHIMHEVTIGDVLHMRRSDESVVVLGLGRNGRRTSQ